MVAVGQVERDTARGARALWAHVFGEGKGFLCIFSGRRPAPGSKQLVDVEESFWPYPQSALFAEQEAYQQDALGREVYFCAHLLREKRRRKEAAAPVRALWADADGAGVPPQLPAPSLVVQSSPLRHQLFWRLSDAAMSGVAEEMNRRLAYAMGADMGGWDLTQLLRVPGCHNRKYPGAPEVELLWTDPDAVLDPSPSLLPPVPDRPQPVEPSHARADDNGDREPPVRLDAAGLAWWRGERTAAKEDGSVDRSETLWGIARALWAGGASRGTVAAALAERDAALGYGRYTDRPAEYLRIVGKLGDAPEEPPASGGACHNCARLGADLARERREKQEVIELNRAMRKVLANEDLKQEGRAALGLAFEVWDRRERGDTKKMFDNDGAPYYEYHPSSAGKKVAMSEDAISKAKSRLQSWGLLKGKAPAIRTEDPETGEESWRRESYLHIEAPTIPAWLDVVGGFKPTEEQCQRAKKKPWGGPRWRCAEHPDAVVEYTTVARCTACGCCSEPMVEYVDAAGNVAEAPEEWVENRSSIGKPQDAATRVYEDTTETVLGETIVPPESEGWAVPIMDAADWSRIMRALQEREGNVCHYCGIDLEVIPLDVALGGRIWDLLHARQRTIDHKVPVSQGGTDDLENLVLSCRTCNTVKGTRGYEWFMATLVPGIRESRDRSPIPEEMREEVRELTRRARAEAAASERKWRDALRVGGSVRHGWMGPLPVVAVAPVAAGLAVTVKMPNGDERTFLDSDLKRGVWREIPR